MRSRVWRFMVVTTTLAVVLAGCAPRGAMSNRTETSDEAVAAVKARVATDLGKLPLYFVENRGQLDPRVGYYVSGRDTSVYFTPGGLTFALTGKAAAGTRAATEPRDAVSEVVDAARERWALKLDFVGADPAVVPVGQDPTSAVVSYLKGSEAEWKSGLPTYGGVVYENLWPGIDLVYGGAQDRLKYTFVVRPGTDPGQIKLAYRGATGLELGSDGRLVVTTPIGTLEDEAPYVYQDVDGRRVDVAAAYALEPDGGQGYGFQLGGYDRSLPLVVDPAVLVYAGFLGGVGDDQATGIAVDSAGNAYVAGTTSSTEATFPETAGAFRTSLNGTSDAFVAKVNSAGSALIYATYLGGSGDEAGAINDPAFFGIAVDGAGNAFVTGRTTSTNFPITLGAAQPAYGGGATDGFVVKLNPAGNGLVYGTYLGGANADQGNDIAIDGAGNAYVVGTTTSGNFPTTVGAFQVALGGKNDAFIVKLDASGATRVYSTFLGGNDFEEGRGIAVDAAGNAYVTGFTQSNNFPTTPGVLQPARASNTDAFVTKLNPAGSAPLVYSTYFGGAAEEQGRDIAIDGAGNAYITGFTRSDASDFPETPGAFDVTLDPTTQFDAFIAKINPTGTSTVYATYLGGAGFDSGNGIAVDATGNAYIAGFTESDQASFPETPDAFDTTFNGGTDAFIAKLNPSGSALVFASFLGGAGIDSGNGIALDSSGNAYIAGATGSLTGSFPATSGSFGTTFGGGPFDAFVAKVSEQAGGGGGGTGPADLAVTVTAAPSTVARNGAVTYSLTATNVGGTPATSQVRLILKLPPSITAATATSPNGTCLFAVGTPAKPLSRVLCQVGSLAPGASATATVTVNPPTAGPLPATAVARPAVGAPADPVTTNDRRSVTVTVTP